MKWMCVAVATLLIYACGDGKSPTSSNSLDIDVDNSNSTPVVSRAERLRSEASALVNSLGFETPRPQTDIPTTLSLADGTNLTIEYGDSVFYKLSGISSFLDRDYMIRPLLDNQFLVENRFLKSGSETISIVYISRDPSVVEVSDSGGLRFVAPGKTSVIVGVGSKYVDLPMEVVTITDLKRNQTKTQVIEKWGLADGFRSATLDWLDSVTLNVKDYYNSEAGEDLYIEQWYYDRLLRGYLEFRGGRSDRLSLYQIRTTRWEHVLFSPVYPQFYTKK